MPGGAGRDDYSPMPTGGSGANYGHSGTGDGQHVKTRTVHTPNKKTIGTKDHTGKVISGIGFATNLNPLKAIGSAVTWGKSLFAKTPEQKRASYIKKGLDIHNPAEMHGYQTQYGKRDEDTYTGETVWQM